MTAHPVLAEVIRSGYTESWHRGSLVVIDGSGAELLALGSADEPMFPRSSNKPMQAAAMLRSGLDLDGELLALASASHSGEEFHIEGVRQILRGAGLSESELQCPRDLPLDETARAEFLRAGGKADRIHMNCSGKHAAMLATCVARGWPVGGYKDPAHPLQEKIKIRIGQLAAEPVARIGVDGCGAPLMSISLTGLARAFSAVVRAEPGSAERQVADAMRGYPAWMSGTTRYEAAFMEAVPGLLMKPGADGVCAFAFSDGVAGAVKIDDGGGQRALPPVLAELLLRLLGDRAADLEVLSRLAETPVLGGGEPVGSVKPVLPALAR
ncbi:MAG TPA: asparaginase [Streptosporangiaceae bacterium]|nr:asparaginase [Streptosporangiaceae bacterium]